MCLSYFHLTIRLVHITLFNLHCLTISIVNQYQNEVEFDIVRWGWHGAIHDEWLFVQFFSSALNGVAFAQTCFSLIYIGDRYYHIEADIIISMQVERTTRKSRK